MKTYQNVEYLTIVTKTTYFFIFLNLSVLYSHIFPFTFPQKNIGNVKPKEELYYNLFVLSTCHAIFLLFSNVSPYSLQYTSFATVN